jgi:hypothetical protein
VPLTIQLEPSAQQTAFNLKRWAELLADPELARLPHRIETDRHGHILMSPPPAPQHGNFQSEVTPSKILTHRGTCRHRVSTLNLGWRQSPRRRVAEAWPRSRTTLHDLFGTRARNLCGGAFGFQYASGNRRKNRSLLRGRCTRGLDLRSGRNLGVPLFYTPGGPASLGNLPEISISHSLLRGMSR